MAQLLIRRIEEDVKQRLLARARRHGRSTEEEVREILRAAVRDEYELPVGLGTRIAERFAEYGLDEDVPELRGSPVRPADLDQ